MTANAKQKVLRAIKAHPGIDEYDLAVELSLPMGEVFEVCALLHQQGKIKPDDNPVAGDSAE